MPATLPEVESTTMLPDGEDHVPPAVAQASVMSVPVHIDDGPEMAAMPGETTVSSRVVYAMPQPLLSA